MKQLLRFLLAPALCFAFLMPLSGQAQSFVYSQTFTSGSTYCPGSAQYDNWGTFRSQLDTNLNNFTSLTFTGSLNTTGFICNDPVTVAQVAEALRTGTPGSFTCGGTTWVVGNSCNTGCSVNGDDIELAVNSTACNCSNTGVRPCIGNTNWGGLGGTACSAPTQSFTVTFNYFNGPPPNPTGVTGGGTVCAGSSTTLTVQGGVGTPQWYTGSCGGTLIGSGNSITVNPTSGPVIYYVRNFSGGQFSAGCSFAIVNVNPSPTASITASSDVSCNGASNGTASVTASGGTGSLSILWPSGNTNSLETGLTAGTHVVTVTDANGCTATASAVINQPSAITGSAAVNDATCPTDSDGSITITPTGGSGSGYSYLWSNGSTSATLGSLSPGTYTVTISDGLGCTGTAQGTVSSSNPVAAPAVSASSTTICPGSISPITLTANNGGSGSSNYLNTRPTQTSSSAGPNFTFNFPSTPTGAVGNATLTVFYRGDLNSTGEIITFFGESNYNIGTSNFTSQCPSSFSSKTFSISSSLIDTWAANGTITIIADAASSVGFCATSVYMTLSYSVSNVTTYWFSGNCSQVVSSAIGTGTSLSVTPTATTTYYAANNDGTCWSTCDSVTVTLATPPAVFAFASNSTICQGSSTVLSALGASTYSWSPSTGLNSTTGATVLASPSATTIYTVTGTDTSGCTNTAQVTVSVNPAPVISSTTSSPTCVGGADGSATVLVSGATSPYTYQWSTGGTSASLSGLSAGTYTVTVTDQLGCSSTSTISVTSPSAVSAVFSTSAPSCFQASDGSIIANGIGGSGSGYSFAWSNGGSTSLISGLVAGTYTVTVTDGNGCTGIATSTLTDPAPLTAPTVSSSSPSICQGSGSSVNLISTGGTGTTYWFANTCVQSTSAAIGTGNVFAVTPTTTTTYFGRKYDGTCWSSCNSVTIFVNTPPTVGATASASPICQGSSSVLSAFGAVTYSWSPSTGLNTTIGGTVLASPISTTVYTVTGSDANGCTGTATVTVVVNPAPVLSTSSSAPTCNGGSDGSATVLASGATSPYTYNWSSGSTSNTTSGLPAGTYSVTVTDALGCSALTFATVTQPAAVSASFSTNAPSCNLTSDGSAIATGIGGSGSGYSFLWPSGTTSALETGLSAGSYVVTITDGLGCTGTATVTVTAPAPVGAPSVAASPTSICQGSGASVFLSSTNSGSGSGNYSNTLSAGCSSVDGGVVSLNFTGTPTGATGNATLTVFYRGDLDATSEFINYRGESNFNIGNSNSATQCSSSYSSKSFTISSAQINAWAANGTITITADASSGVNNFCSGNSFCTYATLTYSYFNATTYWFAGSCSQNVSAAIGTGSSLTVTPTTTTTYYAANFDGSCWSSCDSVTVPVIAPPTIIASTSSSSVCIGSSTVLSATGANTYVWSPGSSLNTTIGATVLATPTTGTLYNVIGTDANGCTGSATVAVSVNPSPSLAITSQTNATCNGSSDGSVTIAVAGSSGPYTYAWSSGSSSNTATGLSAGAHTVSVTDALGCTGTLTATITQPASISGIFSTVAATCFTSNDGSATVSGVGGSGSGYSYQWPSGTTGAFETGLAPGTYTVTITDGNGCTGTDNVTIISPPALSSPGAITASQSSICSGSGSTVNLSTSGIGSGSGTYTMTTSTLCSQVDGGVLTMNFTGAPTGATGNAVLTVFYNGDLDALGEDITYSGEFGTFIGTSNSTTQCATTFASKTFSISAANIDSWAANGTITITADADATVNNFCSGNSFCTYATLTYNYFNATTYWFAGNCAQSVSSSIGSGNSLTVSPNSTITYYASNFDGTCWSPCDSTTIAVLPQPSVNVSPSTASVCGGNSVPLVASGANTYSWSPSGTLNTSSGPSVVATPTSSTTYTVTGTGTNGCSATATASIAVFPGINLSAVPTVYNGGVNISCNGQNDGNINLTVNGGQSPFTYSWTGPSGYVSNLEDINNLSAGTYSVTVTDANGCTETTGVTLTEPNVLTLTLTPSVYNNGSNVSCNGGSNGSLTSSVNGGTTSYTYAWVGPNSFTSTAASPTGLQAGTYDLTVTDQNGCTAASSFTMTEPTAIQVTLSAPTLNGGFEISCNGGSDGSINSTVSGGASPYTYSWSGPGGFTSTSANPSNLSAGTYTVTVTDDNGCIEIENIVLTEPTVISGAVTTSSFPGGNNVSCFGASDGTISLIASGGISPYTYAWSGPGGFTSSSNNLSQLVAGNYNVTITDDNNCTVTQTVTLTQPANLSISFAITDATCQGGSDGSITATVSGGSAPFTYSWSDPNQQTTATASGLPEGSFALTVTDANGCSFIDIATVGFINAAPTVSLGNDTAICSGVSLPLSPGSFSSYLWSDNSTNPTLTVNQTGSYSVTVTDANTCTNSDTIQVNVNALPFVNLINDTSVCDTIQLDAGAGFVSYLWSDNTQGQQLTVNTTGTYGVTVTDGNGCTNADSVNVTIHPAVNLSLSTVDASCGNSDGEVTATATGGDGNFNYLWNTGSATSSLTGLLAGTYAVTVTDGNGCSATDVASVSSVGGPSITLSSTDISCFGANDGSATLTATGGSTPYVILWNNGAFSTSLNGLSAGTYSVSVTDNGGCTAVGSVTINEPTQILPVPASTLASCGGSDGTASVNTTGGVSPYTYIWDDPAQQTTATATGLPAGLYNVTVTDANGCSSVVSSGVSNANAATVSVAGVDVTCEGGQDGEATATVSGGGTAPFTYAWNDPSNQSTANATGLSAGSYNVVVTDSLGCVTVGQTIIGFQHPRPVVDLGNDTVICNDAEITLDAGGGFASYLWSTSAIGQTIQVNDSGIYHVTVEDFNTCVGSDTIRIRLADCVGFEELAVEPELVIYPNPSNGIVNLRGKDLPSGDLQLEVYHSSGQLVHREKLVSAPGEFFHTLDLSSTAQGVYLLRISGSNFVSVQRVTIK